MKRASAYCGVTGSREATVDVTLHRVGRRLGLRFVAGSVSNFSLRAVLAGATTLPPFMLPRFWPC